MSTQKPRSMEEIIQSINENSEKIEESRKHIFDLLRKYEHALDEILEIIDNSDIDEWSRNKISQIYGNFKT